MAAALQRAAEAEGEAVEARAEAAATVVTAQAEQNAAADRALAAQRDQANAERQQRLAEQAQKRWALTLTCRMTHETDWTSSLQCSEGKFASGIIMRCNVTIELHVVRKPAWLLETVVTCLYVYAQQPPHYVCNSTKLHWCAGFKRRTTRWLQIVWLLRLSSANSPLSVKPSAPR